MKKIIFFLLYLVRTYCVSLLTIIVVAFVTSYIMYQHYNLEGLTSHPVIAVLLAGAVLPPINLLLFLILYYHKFTLFEIMCESVLLLIINPIVGVVIYWFTGDVHDGLWFSSLSTYPTYLLTLFLVVKYLSVKRKINNPIMFDIKCGFFLIFSFFMFECCYWLEFFPWFH